MKSIKFGVKPIEKMIESTPEYMRKLFIMPDSPDKFLEFGNELLDLIHTFFKENGAASTVKSPFRGDRRRFFPTSTYLTQPQLWKTILQGK